VFGSIFLALLVGSGGKCGGLLPALAGPRPCSVLEAAGQQLGLMLLLGPIVVPAVVIGAGIGAGIVAFVAFVNARRR
jgi:ABC-type spermidine/putrescine transport system permease subunit II